MTGRILRGLGSVFLSMLMVSTAVGDVVGLRSVSADSPADFDLAALSTTNGDVAPSTDVDLSLPPAAGSLATQASLSQISESLSHQFIVDDGFPAPRLTATNVSLALDRSKLITLPELSSFVLLTLTGAVSLIVWWVRRKGSDDHETTNGDHI